MKLKLTSLAAAVTAVLAVGSAHAAGRSDLVLASLASGQAQYTPGELLVQFSPHATANDRLAVRQGLGAERLETVRAHGRDGGGALELMRLPPGLAIADAVRGLEHDSAIEYAEPNWTYFPSVVSNDPGFSQTWGMQSSTSTPANAFGSQAATAWANGKQNCGDVVVGIIDEGYMYTHEDLAANAFKNPGEVAGNGLDDDGNGYADDVWGWDFDGGDSSLFDGATDDHATHVAGTIGGVGGNGKGVAGVCWQVRLMGAKFLGRRGGSTANAVKAVDYFTDLKTRHGLNIVATNNSWGGGGFAQTLEDAIKRANTANILFIAAAGNGATNNDATASFPSNYNVANVLAVASITSTGGLSSFSQWGATTVDLGAPGSSIYSSVPVSSKGAVLSGYATYSGTSMATPHVSGAAALWSARYTVANPLSRPTAAQVKAGIMNTTTATPSLSGMVVTGGRLNVSTF